jgi:stage III sporulation protein SpoIIIAA
MFAEEEALLPERTMTDDLEMLMVVIPPHIRRTLEEINNRNELLEVIMDLGRKPEARYVNNEIYLSEREITQEDLEAVVSRIGSFGSDNRAGIERTLHRISCIRNRAGKIVGLTIRIGRAVYGTINIIRDLVESGQSILLVGPPGVGKTTLLRETARVLADELRKRVIIVDTSNEIAGDGDIPHPAIGRSRRMQVARPDLQHNVMIEGVENHMPEVIVIDEIGTELEAQAARTIAERGVQLIGTAHGVSLENLMLNPTLSDLIGGIQTVTLGDEEARRRGTQKSVLERKAPPTFDVMVEIRHRDRVAVHLNVADTVDAILRGQQFMTQIRQRNERGEIEFLEEESEAENSPASGMPAQPPDYLDMFLNGKSGGRPNSQSERGERGERGKKVSARPLAGNGSKNPARVVEPEIKQIAPPADPRFSKQKGVPVSPAKPLKVYPHGINRTRLEEAIRTMGVPADLVRDLKDADVVITLKNYYRQKPLSLRQAESEGTPIYILKSNTLGQMESCLADVFNVSPPVASIADPEPGEEEEFLDSDPVKNAIYQTEEAVVKVIEKGTPIELSPQNAFIRRLQHQIAERYNLTSQSKGREPFRRVKIYPQG